MGSSFRREPVERSLHLCAAWPSLCCCCSTIVKHAVELQSGNAAHSTCCKVAGPNPPLKQGDCSGILVIHFSRKWEIKAYPGYIRGPHLNRVYHNIPVDASSPTHIHTARLLRHYNTTGGKIATHPFANLIIFLCLWFPVAIDRHCCCCPCPPRTSHGPCREPLLPPIAAPRPRPADEEHPGLAREDQSNCGLIFPSTDDHDIAPLKPSPRFLAQAGAQYMKWLSSGTI